jgi:hypothetical protein
MTGSQIAGGPLASMVATESAVDTMSVPTELMQLRIRVIALENLVISLLARAPDAQLHEARDMAAYISPRAGHTPHHLTLRAADEMRSLVHRANQFRAAPATAGPAPATARSSRV